MDFDLALARTLAHASAMAYADSHETIRRDLSADSVDTFAGASMFGYVACVGNDVFLVFRGTVMPLPQWEHSIRQWIANLDFHQVDVSTGRVHRGFNQALDAVWDHAHQLVKNRMRSDRRLWVTGHSLGGALAILAGMRLHVENHSVSGVYTFGAPAVGDAGFASSYKPLVHRVENHCDIIGRLPPTGTIAALISKVVGPLVGVTGTSYGPIGKLTIVNEHGGARTIDSPADQATAGWMRTAEMAIAAGAETATLLEDHKIATYVSRLAIGRASRQNQWLIDLPVRILRAIPKLKRIGGMLYDGAGRVIGFLQETGFLQRAVSDGGTGGIISGAAGLAEDPAIRQMLSSLSTLQLLNGATLAATVVGIGINVAGFAMVLDRLKRVEMIASDTRREAVAARLAAERVNVMMTIRDRSARIGYLERAEEAWAYSDPVPIWKKLESDLFDQLNYEECLLGKNGPSIFLDGRFTLEECTSAYESVLHLDAARFQTLLLVGEERVALASAENMRIWHQACVFQLGPDAIAQARSKSDDDLRALLRKATAFKEKVLEIDRHLACRIKLIRHMLDHGINGRAYIEESRQNLDSPLMILPVT